MNVDRAITGKRWGRTFTLCARAVALGALCLVSGCGTDRVPTYPVTGRIVFADGRPVRHGRVEVESREHGLTATGTIEHDGTFVLGTYTADDGAVAGTHSAIVVQIVIADGSFTHSVDHGRPVPVRYADYGTSPLEVTVEPQPNQIELQLSVE